MYISKMHHSNFLLTAVSVQFADQIFMVTDAWVSIEITSPHLFHGVINPNVIETVFNE